MKTKIKLFLLIFVVLAVSCKTKEKLIYKTDTRIDITEVVSLKSQLSIKENQLISLSEELRATKNQLFSSIEKLHISESEKQNLKESFETSIKKYNDKGILIEEINTKKTSELLKDISKYKEENKALTARINAQISTIKTQSEELSKATREVSELNKKADVLTKEKTDLTSKKVNDSFSFKSALYGALGLLIVQVLLFVLVKLKVIRLPF